MLALSCSPAEPLSGIEFPTLLEGKDPSLVALVRTSIGAVNREPEDLAACLRLGFVYEANDLDSLALETYDRALAIADTSARAWHRIFAACRRLGDSARAAEANARALELAPGYAPLHIRSGFWHLDLDRRSEAERSFRRSIELDPANPGGYWGRARVAMLDKQPERAVELLQGLLKDHRPDHPYTHQLLGAAYRQAGRWQEARIALEKGHAAGRSWPDPWEEEVQAYETGLQVELARARNFVARGAPQLAIATLLELEQLHPESLIVPKMLGKTLVQTRQWERALEVYARAQGQHPDDAELFQGMAAVHFGMGDPSGALSALEGAIAIDSTSAAAHAGRGSILMQQRRLTRAKAAFETAARLEPDEASHLVQLGMVECELQLWGEALASFRRATGIDSTRHEGYLGWAVAARGMGNVAEAEKALLRARAVRPESETVNSLLQTIRRQKAN